MDEEYLYQKISTAIKRDIENGVYQPGDDLPSIRKLKETWHCTIGTIQRALQKLEMEGLISIHVGKSSKVNASGSQHPMDSLRRANLINRTETFLLDMIASGYSPIEAEDSFRLALERWRSVSQTQGSIEHEILRFAGSHDLAVAWMATHFDEVAHGVKMHLNFCGSLSGLMALAEGKADLAGSHLWDAETDTYNLPYLNKLFPGERIALIHLANRRIGWFVQPGNPKQFTGLRDLARTDLRMVNRNVGSGIRVYLDSNLTRQKISSAAICGYENQKMNHTDVAVEVAEGRADVGLGMEAAAKTNHIDFIFETLERYDLILKEKMLERQSIQELLGWIKSVEFVQLLERLGGYDSTESGKILFT